jgi:hypothetical protein
MLSPAARVERVIELVEQEKYFTLVAGPQTGKTTSLKWLANRYNRAGQYLALWVDIQTAREVADPAEAFRAVLEKVAWAVRLTQARVELPAIDDLLRSPRTAVLQCLSRLAESCERPVVVLSTRPMDWWARRWCLFSRS